MEKARGHRLMRATEVLEKGNMGNKVWQMRMTTEALERMHGTSPDTVMLRGHYDLLQLCQERMPKKVV